MRVLLVAYYFPPAAGGGVQRVLKWAKYLPQSGVDVHVLTPDDPKWLDADGGLHVQPGTHVHRCRNLSPRSIRPGEELARARGPLARTWRRIRLAPRRLAIPDVRIAWRLTAVRAGVRVVREQGIDVIVSTSPPETDHVVAAAIARRCGIPWVADFRDSWLDLPHTRLERRSVRLKHALNVRLATRVMRQVAAITTVSDPLAIDLRTRHPHASVHVVENGMDLADLAGMAEPDRNERLTLVYTGSFFGRQSPRTFLDALEQLDARVDELSTRMSVQMIGGMSAADDERIATSPVLSVLIGRQRFMDWDDILSTQRAADLLLLYVAPGRGSQGVFTGKVFEYVAARRPVLALAPPDNVAVELLGAAGSGIVVDPDDDAAITDALEHELRRWEREGRRSIDVPDAVMHRISRQRQTAVLASLLRDVMTRHGGGATDAT